MKKITFLLLGILLSASALLRAQVSCDAQFTTTHTPYGNNLLRVQFTNTSNNGSGAYSNFHLYYGDGDSESFSSYSLHNYAAPGTYNATLVMTTYDSSNLAICSDTLTQAVQVDYSPCGATVSATNNGGGSYTFTANNPAGTSGMVYNWNFGDGSTGTGSTVTHTYAFVGTYIISLQATGGGCTYNNTINQYIINNTTNCDSLNSGFDVTVSGMTADFTNTSTIASSLYFNSYWGFGDGSWNTGNNISHNYAAPGTYAVSLATIWYDSLTMAFVCADTIWQNVTINAINCDSLNASFNTTASGMTAGFTSTSNSYPSLYTTSYWTFGDGNGGVGNAVSHTYTATGTYPVSLATIWYDSLTMTFVCADTVWQNITINAIDCNSLYSGFYFTVSGMSADFTSTPGAAPGVTSTCYWDFGDGNGGIGDNVSHTYATAGSYPVSMITVWADSITLAWVCTDTTLQNVVTDSLPPVNLISGNVYWDSLGTTTPDSIKVWLIVYDSLANTLTAIDSQMINAFSPQYYFYNQPAGFYRVKAAVHGQPVSSTGWVPTYHYSSLYWSAANTILHTGGIIPNADIMMQTGTVTAGPGFIGGNISLGAGKGTATGVPDMLVFLRKAGNELVTSTYTDADGNYSFSNIPEGTYNVYPEAMNYATTPSATLTIAAGQLTSQGNDFEQNESEIVPLNGLSISGLSKEDGITAYPNPVNHTLFIESRNKAFNQVTVMNTLGQVVLQQTLKPGLNKIETSALNAGIYYVLIRGDKAARSMKISKK